MKVYVLKEDLMLRGVDNVMDGITQVDYAGFVDLVEENKTASW
jgi:tRNA 2-thiouridine synthesizing protein B